MSVLIVVLACINIFLWLFFFVRFRKRCSPDAVLGHIKRDMDALITSMNRETDRDVTLIEGRIKSLRALIEEADRRIVLANSEDAKRRREEAVLISLNREQGIQSPVQGEAQSAMQTNLARAAAAYRMDSALRPSMPPPFEAESPAPETTELPPLAEAPVLPRMTVAQKPITPQKDMRTRVLEMRASGLPAELIAEKLSVSITEVEMVISLYGS